MSRLAHRNAPTSTATSSVSSPRPQSNVDTSMSSSNETCPVCKSSRYLNPNMTFLVNPECYHKMCSSCVDRIFSHGPAQCPVAGCRRTLRKHRFRKQTFEDVAVEREVDVRKKVGEIMNRREDDFETSRSYNDYLETVETLVHNLLHNIDIARTEKTLAQYKDSFGAASISRNQQRERDELAAARAAQNAERENAKVRRGAARREADEEKRLREEEQRWVIDRLAQGGGEVTAEDVAREAERVRSERMERQTHEREREEREAAERRRGGSSVLQNGTQMEDTNNTSYVIRGLRDRTKVAKENAFHDVPYDPFDGLIYEHLYFNLRDFERHGNYDWAFTEQAVNDPLTGAGGYDIHGYCERVLCEGFAGLGVFVGDEAMPANGDVDMATEGAAIEAAT